MEGSEPGYQPHVPSGLDDPCRAVLPHGYLPTYGVVAACPLLQLSPNGVLGDDPRTNARPLGAPLQGRLFPGLQIGHVRNELRWGMRPSSATELAVRFPNCHR